MKKIIILLVAALFVASCGEELEFNTPALQGKKDGSDWRADYYEATIDNGRLIVSGGRGSETIVLNIASPNVGSYTLGVGNSSNAIFNNIQDVDFSTNNDPDPNVQIYPADGEIVIEEFSTLENTVSGTFWFNAFTDQGLEQVNFSQGVFYQIPVSGGGGSTIVSCDEAVAASANAAANYAAVTMTDSAYTNLCNAYATALAQQIVSCGDDTGVLQTIIDSLGSCEGANSATIYINALIDGVPFNSEFGTTYISAMSGGPRYGQMGCIDIIYEPSLFPNQDTTLPSLGVGFYDFLTAAGISCYDEVAFFDNLFSLGIYDYAPTEYEYGIGVNYYKGTTDGNNYESFGSQDASANFEITEVTPIDCPNNPLVECLIIAGTFNCKLYNESDPTDDFIDVTNGEFRLHVNSYNL